MIGYFLHSYLHEKIATILIFKVNHFLKTITEINKNGINCNKIFSN